MLGGEPLRTFEHCRKTSNGLKEIVNDMIIMYGKTITINDYKRQLNEFTREAGESIRKTMLRYRQILNKTKHGVPDKVWKHTSQLKQMLALKMFISAKTKAEIEQEEARNDNEGSTMLPIEHWINRVEEFETAHNEVPTKAIKPMILTATMAPAQQLEEFQAQGKQLQHYKVNHFNQTKDLVDAIQHLNQKIDQISINSAMPKSNPKLDALRKPYSHAKFAPKTTNYVKHPQAIPTQGELVNYTAVPKQARAEAMDTAQVAPTAQSQAQGTQQPQQDGQQAQAQRGGGRGGYRGRGGYQQGRGGYQQGRGGYQQSRGGYQQGRGRGGNRPRMLSIQGELFARVNELPRARNYVNCYPQQQQYSANSAEYYENEEEYVEGEYYKDIYEEEEEEWEIQEVEITPTEQPEN